MRLAFELLGRPVEIDEGMPGLASGNLAITFGDFYACYVVNDRTSSVTLLLDPFTNKHFVDFLAFRHICARDAGAMRRDLRPDLGRRGDWTLGVAGTASRCVATVSAKDTIAFFLTFVRSASSSWELRPDNAASSEPTVSFTITKSLFPHPSISLLGQKFAGSDG